MSRGLSQHQRDILSALRFHGIMDTIQIACWCLSKKQITLSEASSFRRALRTLARDGLVAPMGRNYPDGRRRWGLPLQVAQYNKRVQDAFGKDR